MERPCDDSEGREVGAGRSLREQGQPRWEWSGPGSRCRLVCHVEKPRVLQDTAGGRGRGWDDMQIGLEGLGGGTKGEGHFLSRACLLPR